jgi:repressor LexA
MSEQMTPAQQRVYDHITAFIETYGYSPTIRQVTEALDYGSPATVQRHVKILVRKGYLKGAGRSLTLG